MTRKKRNKRATVMVNREAKTYAHAMASRMPVWRETCIKTAHKALLASKPKPKLMKRLSHPVLIGDRG